MTVSVSCSAPLSAQGADLFARIRASHALDTRPTTIEYGDAFALIAEMARGFAEARDFDGVLA